jgi:creatinine amidohydrolase
MTSISAIAVPRSHAIADLPWTAVAAHLAGDRRLIVPVGNCEQQGPHLPVGAATTVAERLADDLSREFGVLRAPTLHYGVNPRGERDFAGGAGLSGKTLHRALNELVSALSVGLAQFLDGEKGPEHAGEALTSLLLHLRPAVVRMERARDFVLDPGAAEVCMNARERHLPGESPGSVGQPTLASAEKGREMYEHILQKIRNKVFIAPPADEEEA